jgi:dTDP-4-dehydrorhamnose 3,5-epimerase
MPFEFKKLEIPEMILIEPKVFGDDRGFFMESYKYSEFAALGIKEKFVQENHSKSEKNVLRGLHFQKNPKAQAKIVRCVKGEIFDVGVDIRKGSPTYRKWAGVILSAENKKQLYIPAGFAHGFCVLSDEAEVCYKISEEYSLENEREIIWNDPEININWPACNAYGEVIAGRGIKNPILSEKDSKAPFLKDADNNFKYE